MEPPNPEPVDLTRPHKNSFAPDVDPSPLMMEDSVFEALRSIQWLQDDLQTAETSSTVQADPASSGANRESEGQLAGSQP
jgi:hypothetical protein